MRFASRSALLAAGLLGGGCQTNTTAVNYQPLPAPASISSISLDSAIYLNWADNAFQSDPQRFLWYYVYSAKYDLDAGVCVDTTWALEGTTVAHEFLAGALPNGVRRCFETTAISKEGLESAPSPNWQDTPRPDGRSVLVWAVGVNTPQAGFRFWDDMNGNGYGDPGELGLVQDGTRSDIDFRVYLDPSDSSLWFAPVFAGDSLQLYASSPIADLTSIDFAPATGYARDSIKAMPGYGYVFEWVENNEIHYAGLRVAAVTHQYVIFDWSVQTDPGNAELVAPRPVALTGKPVVVSR
ncbi:MAG TPA: hypothetical protein VEM13_02500 [Gemmatimonadales bacterium]|nr:hypothetical protein [Gemmatimonadales bacterium]